ncbi:hypothetical protein [Mangrovicoccus ximenensis]|uniref:hypothetical protein n=1 Tax=Mangrovicoccus ximenensis TaxID=1911570 RepID=UPI0011AE5955|nr:hypothetical protein [Mangrovicoccus ximenensis]
MPLLAILALAAALLQVSRRPAEAQVPPHPPGTVCFTPYFWCWLPAPQPVGTTCACFHQQAGWVYGTAG